MKQLFRLIFLSFIICSFSFSFSVYSQSLTLQSFGSPSVTDVLQSSNLNASARGVVLDVHEASGISVYVWTEPDNVSLPSGNHDIYCALYDKNMIQIQSTFLVNLNTTGDQVQPAIKINQVDNTFIVVWASNHGTDGQYDVYAKKINLYTQNVSLVAALTDNVINTDYTYLRQQTPKLAYDYTYDEVIIGWRDGDGQDSSGTGVYARRVSNTNFPSFVASQFLVNQTRTNNQVLFDMEVSSITGSLYVLYSSISATTGTDIFTRRYNRNASDGSYTALSETMRNVTTTGEQWNPGFKFNRTTGSYVISWNSDNQDGSGRGIYFKVYDQTDASLTGEIRGSIPTANAQFTLRTAWDEESGYLMQLYVYNGGAVTIKYQLFDNTFATVGSETDALSGTNIVYSDAYYSIAYSQQSKNLYLNYIVFSGTDVGKTYARYFKYSNPTYAPPTCVKDSTRNWTSQAVYNEYGVKVKEQRAYVDQIGRTRQTQARDFENKNTLAVSTLYDRQGIQALQTLPAPTNSQCFSYNSNFINYQSGGSTYPDYTIYQFDAATGSGSVNIPIGLGNNSGVGWYYSGNNTSEPYVASSSYPYYRAYTNSIVAGGVNKSTSPGDDVKQGSGKEVRSFTAPLLSELDHYIGLRNSYFATSGSSLTTLAYQGIKQFSIDENGIVNVSFVDQQGRQLAKALLDGTVYTPVTAKIAPSDFYYYTYTNSTGANVSLYISGTDDVMEAYDLTVASTLSLTTDVALVVTTGHTVQLRSKGNFAINGITSAGTTFASTPIIFQNTNTPSAVDVYINNPSSFSITANANDQISIINAETGAVVYSGVKSGFTSLSTAGFYRIRIRSFEFASSYTSRTNISLGYSCNYTNFSYNIYDNAGRRVAQVAPNSLVPVAPNGINSVSTSNPVFKTVYTFSSVNLLLSQNSLDEGLVTQVFRKDGSLRFKQNAKQTVSGNFSYTNYDIAGRVLETGEYDKSHGAVVFQTAQSFITSPVTNSSGYLLETVGVDGGFGSPCSCRTQKTYMTYDVVSSTFPATPNIPVSRTAAFISGRLVMSSNDSSITWYSYDELHRMAWTVQKIVGLNYKTTDYQYDLQGNVLKLIYQRDTTERFEHRYTYDKNQRLKLLETKAGSGVAMYQTQEKVIYYLHGPLKRRELAVDLQGIDYVYTIQGWLKSINSPNLDASDPGGDNQTGNAHVNFAADVFGMLFEYYTPLGATMLGEYGKYGSKCSKGLNNSHITTSGVTDKYNGTVKAMRWQTRSYPNGTGPSQYVFEYDTKYQLKTATFGNISGPMNCSGSSPYYEFTASANYNVNNLTYDANGNIQHMYTSDNAATYTDKFDYHYISNTNRLDSVKINGTSNLYATYQYNQVGQMTQQKQNTKVDVIDYNAYGLTSQVTETSTGTKIQVQFVYDERGHRIKKRSYSTAGVLLFTTYYVNDASGRVLSIYDNNSTSLAQKELPIYGSVGRIAVAYKTTTYNYQYEITDQLGNVRAVIAKVSGTLSILNYKDFYPHGAVMPSRKLADQRHDYQGQYAEKDTETGYNAFELRMYDARIGRWLSSDPMGQYWSPYMAMGNNPVRIVDPTGGDGIGGGGGGDEDPEMPTGSSVGRPSGATTGNPQTSPLGPNGGFYNGTWSAGTRSTGDGFDNNGNPLKTGGGDDNSGNDESADDTGTKIPVNGVSTGTQSQSDDYNIKSVVTFPNEPDRNPAQKGDNDKVQTFSVILSFIKDDEYYGYSGNNLFLSLLGHYNSGGGTDFHVNTKSLNIRNVTQRDIKTSSTGKLSLNLLNIDPYSQEGISLGKIGLIAVGANQYLIEPDIYDFNIEWNQGLTFRNVATVLGFLTNNFASFLIPAVAGGPFTIQFHGPITIQP